MAETERGRKADSTLLFPPSALLSPPSALPNPYAASKPIGRQLTTSSLSVATKA